MKKISTLFALLVLTTVSAQRTTDKQATRYGVTANLHQGSIVNVHDVSKGRFGGGVGLVGEIPLKALDINDSYILFFMPSVEFNMGGEIAKADVNLYGKQKYINDYVSANLFLKYYYHPNNYVSNYFIFGGPRVEYLVNQKKTVSAAYQNDYYQYNLDNKINDFGFGVSLGIGADIDDNFEAFLRYDRGLTKVYPDNNLRNTYNHQLSVGVTYYFNTRN